MLLISQDTDLEAVAGNVAQPVKFEMQQRAWATQTDGLKTQYGKKNPNSNKTNPTVCEVTQ